MAVTLKDVAKKAGVGVSTVSYVLNRTGLNKVGIQTQKRVLKVATSLNYRPSIVARGLKKGKTFLVGGIFPAIKDSFVPDILQGLEDAFNDKSYSLILCSYRNRKELYEKCSLLCDKQVDGVVILPEFVDRYIDIYKQIALKMPSVFVTNCAKELPLPHVLVDGEAIGYMGTEYLLQQGHKNIIFIGNDTHRKSGILKAFSEYSVPLNKNHCLDIVHESGWGREVLRKVIKMSPRPTAIFSSSDTLAAEIIDEAINLGIKVPEDISVLGTDGLSICTLIRPRLTTVGQPKYEQGVKAGEMLLDLIDSKVVESCIMQPHLEKRDSVCSL